METLHANAIFAQTLVQALKTTGIINIEFTAYSCFVGMTFTVWNYNITLIGKCHIRYSTVKI